MYFKYAVATSALIFGAGGALADSISPLTYSAELAVGDSVTISKTVVVEASGPTGALIDIHFLFDTSGSMGGVISGAKAAAADIFSSLADFGDVAASVGVYSEAARLPTAPAGSTAPGLVINQDVTTDTATSIAAINAVTLNIPDGGGDGPENGVNGIELAAENLSWRPGSTRFMFVFGDIGFKTSACGEAGGTSGLTCDAFDNQDGLPISTAANALAALSADGVKLFGLDYSFGGSFNSAIETLGGTAFASTTTPGDIVDDITAGITAGFATYSDVTVSDLGAGLPEIGVSVVCTGADIGACSGATATGAYDRTVDRTFTFDVTFERLAAGDSVFSTHALVDGGIVASERDSFTVSAVPLPAAGLMMLGALAGLGAMARRRKAA